MANVQTRGENTERVVIKTESGAERGIGTISYTPSGVDVSLDLKCPTIPDNLDPAERGSFLLWRF